ncbi:hypothetical protein N7520_005085 [Penicillium odoratum]|uniref:uncharacterized protein n=1 Tax=Penicillium odoratum TaxID=1167516 RepID=UPI002546614B|nr:uncharacterized protein N7520_005085 [Penicillium odoratum]KAJ5765526.1 hypothetical protein N7520_005085 [Penicillium odoratum]
MTTFNDPAVQDKGKGKSTDPTNEMSMDEDSSSESEPEVEQHGTRPLTSKPLHLQVPLPYACAFTRSKEDEDMDNNLEPINPSNIIEGGRRTRGKIINYAEIAEQNKIGEDDDDEDDEEYEGGGDDDNDHAMRG